MPKVNDEERLSSDGEWVEDEWVVMEDDIHAKWVCMLEFIHSISILFPNRHAVTPPLF
jgi:hypothetical protein